jgi:hypothetical protein
VDLGLRKSRKYAAHDAPNIPDRNMVGKRRLYIESRRVIHTYDFSNFPTANADNERQSECRFPSLEG